MGHQYSVHEQSIVVINSDNFIIAGFPGFNERIRLPMIVGRPKAEVQGIDATSDLFIGEQIKYLQCALKTELERPFAGGRVVDWHAMEFLWEHVITKELKIDPEMYCLFMNASPEESAKMTDVMFKTFKFPAVALMTDAEFAVLSTYTSDDLKHLRDVEYEQPNGVMVQIGNNNITAVPVVNGYAIPNLADNILPFGSSDVSKYFKRLSDDLSDTPEDDLALIDFTGCYVAENFEDEMEKHSNGTIINVGQFGIFQAPEAFFQPTLMDASMESVGGIDTLVRSVIMKQDAKHHQALFGNIVLCGNAAEIKGFGNRLQAELTDAIGQQEDHPHNSFRVTVHQSTDAVFNGACKVTFLDHTECNSEGTIIKHQMVDGVQMHASYDRVDGVSKHVESGSGFM